MKCPVCDGKGYFPISDIAAKVCPQCNGTGEIEQTNEKWFCQLPTEEKAKRIINIAVNSNCDYETIVKWLKKPHKE